MNTFRPSQRITFMLGPLVFLIMVLWPGTWVSDTMDPVMAVAAWMIVWWIGEAVALPVTALLPIVLFPLMDIMDIGAVTANYANPIVFLFMGGFVIALALEHVQLHKRIALSILKITGTKANGIVLGFMLATALMSMWISNTASTVVMLPIALSVIHLLIDDADGFTKKDQNFALSIMLGIAAAANIGGMATLIGTPPNSVMLAFINDQFQLDIGFLQWMLMGVPFSLIMLFIAYVVIVKVFYPSGLGTLKSSEAVIETQLKKLGPISKGEKTVLVIFLLTALAWIMRSSLNHWFPGLGLSDTLISMIGALAMFTVPLNLKQGSFTLSWEATSRLPWGILILFGGGLALADALSGAGFIEMVGNFMASKDHWSFWLVTTILVTLILFMTELMSNVALVTIMLPVVVGVAQGLDAPLLTLVIPVTLAASCAFMLPMATPPNAIVFASGHVKVHQMVRTGLALNFISVIVLMLLAYLVVPFLF
ncbi:MAG TPA: DASS family sodium-coupled anion symporter [Flavobacteriaceae bacterium]|nr:DASS family sodium-coupled anion symporter [Flavobacteriaceae bacterium]MCB9212129.1 DASS family sodium-coupled anion symporter [Alteromonas sp.]HPF10492.1 DASS family sodium-coupled anion symporter [Flavobacteriaceae bacterium]HQU22111.1 DASS family sodium-coupled anion symporter [Flavobacteriaceae bacterium]HQU66504.1 DASS family sodium-coupled anion symporter [Flavobacteriaceae bacterium]